MTVGAPVALGAHYVLDGGAWKSHGVGTHVPNPEPGQTTHLWDDDARTFGIPPLKTLPTMPTFHPDGATFTGPDAIYADQIAAQGDTLTQIVAKAKALATDPAKLYTLVLSAKTYSIHGFTDGLNANAGVDMPPNVQLWGAGSGRHGGPVTTIRVEPDTSTYTTATCLWNPSDPHSTPKLQILRVSKALPGWGIRHVRIEAGRQGSDNGGHGHPYNGIRFEECPNRVIAENIVIRGTRGYLTHPPGETGHLTTYLCPDFIFRNIEMDGRELGNDSTDVSNRVSSSGIMVNESSGVIIDVTYRYSQCGGTLALWWSRSVSTFNLEARDLGGGVDVTNGQVMGGGCANGERIDLISHYSPRYTLNRIDKGIPSMAFSLNNDMWWDDTTGTMSTTTGVPGRLLIVDAAKDPTSDVYDQPSVSVWHPYDPMSEGPGHYQRNSADNPNGQPMGVTRRGAAVQLSTNKADGSWTTTTRVRY